MAKKHTLDTGSADYKRLLELQEKHNAAMAAHETLEAQLNAAHLDWLRQIVRQAVEIETAIKRIETDTEVLCRKHNGDWFESAQSVKTPLGTVAFRKSTALEVPSEELTMTLVERQDGRKVVGDENALFVAKDFLRVITSLNLEALGTLPEPMLALLKVTRVERESFAMKPAAVELGKMVKEAQAEQKEAA